MRVFWSTARYVTDKLLGLQYWHVATSISSPLIPSSISSPHAVIYLIISSLQFIYRITSPLHLSHPFIYLSHHSFIYLSHHFIISSLEFIYLITSHLFINRITSHPFIYLTSAGANINAVDKLGIDWCSPHCSVACSDCMHPTVEEKRECSDQQRGT